MKTKGISVFERHVEKGVVALFALFAVAMFVWQTDLLGDPNAVEINGERVAPGRAVEVVQAEAGRYASRLDAAPTENEPAPTAEELLAPLRAAMAAGEGPGEGGRVALAESGGVDVGGAEGVGVTTPEGGTFVTVAAPPAVRGVRAATTLGTVDPVEVARAPELAAMVRDEQPYDLAAVTVEGVFPAGEFREALRASPESADATPIPTSWWRDQIELVDVEVEREELAAGLGWGPAELLDPEPGRFSMRAELTSEVTPAETEELVRRARLEMGDIVRPRFYGLVSGVAWRPPSEREEMDVSVPEEVEERVETLDRLDRRLAERRERLRRLTDRPVEEPREREDRRDEQMPGAPGSGGGGGGGGSRDRDARQSQIEAIEEQIAELEAERAAIVDELAEDGYGPSGRPITEGEGAGEPIGEPLTSLTAQGAPDEVTVWVHDPSARPGTTYRYRMRAVTNNPLLTHLSRLPEEQRSAGVEPVLRGAWSSWTEPVRVTPMSAVRVVTASEPSEPTGGGLGRRAARASVEVYEFYYGYWRRAEVSAAPGERVAAELGLEDPLPIWTAEAVELAAAGSNEAPSTRSRRARDTGMSEEEEARFVERRVESLPIGAPMTLVDVVETRAGEPEVLFASLEDGSLVVRGVEGRAGGAAGAGGGPGSADEFWDEVEASVLAGRGAAVLGPGEGVGSPERRRAPGTRTPGGDRDGRLPGGMPMGPRDR